MANDGTRRRWVLPVIGVALVALVAALALFQPWKLVLDQKVDEAAPTAVVERDRLAAFAARERRAAALDDAIATGNRRRVRDVAIRRVEAARRRPARQYGRDRDDEARRAQYAPFNVSNA